ncbi:MAG: hypothetical protein Q9222_004528 [Ikaeria aurantiellina]
MAARVQQDAFVDESDDSCPLCVEEFDLSDKNFRPCPCGYQICQFCYNNIKKHMNGLCPACRRPYDEKNIEFKIISQEEQKAELALQARKKALARQKESERKQVESLKRKDLAGLRVVQKNLVYVVGLNPKSREDELLQTLRGDQYFGQYGKIIKIVVSKPKETSSGHSTIGVYVTFAREQDAASCIAAVDGSQNGDRTLRAQYGTTKYCSAYLRNETCTNRSCMFLHEQGEDHDSFSRQDLSSINAVSTQRPAPQASSSSSAAKPNQQPPQPQPPPQQAPQVVTAASHSMARQGSRDEPMSRSDSGDGSALPSSASWAAKNPQNESRRSSKPSSVSAPSPQVANANTVPIQSSTASPLVVPSVRQSQTPHEEPASESTTRSQIKRPAHPLDRVLETVSKSSYKFIFDRSLYSQETLQEIDAFPPLFDANGGFVRFKLEKQREKERLKQEEEEASKVLGALETADEDENPASGSLQLGGEPETDDGRQSAGGRQSSEARSAIQPPFTGTSGGLPFGNSFFGNAQMFSGRSLTPQQQQQLYLMRDSNRQSPVNTHTQTSFTGQPSQHHHQQSNPFQNQGHGFGIPGHTRQASRFTFANDTPSASTAVKPHANPSLMAQQSAMMPSSQNKTFQHPNMQPSSAQKTHFYSGVQGPPPGLKSSGTPPISGGGMFGQGHGFTQPVGGASGLNGLGASKNSNEQMMQNLLRNRGDTMNGPGPDVGKREFDFSSLHNPSTSNAPASALLNSLYGPHLGAYNGYTEHQLSKQKKKGKKHRHANTSSSGGGGLVDLADPSILQARMHQHGGAGQGPLGLQGQGGYNTNSMVYGGGYGGGQILRQPSPTPTRVPTTSSPGPHNTEVLPPLGPKSKKPTPTPAPAPPGLSSSHEFPPLAAPQAPAPVPAKPLKKINAPTSSIGVIKPVIPAVGSQPGKTPSSGISKQGSSDEAVTKGQQPTKPTSDTALDAIPKPRAKNEVIASDKAASSLSKKNVKSNETAATSTEAPPGELSKKPEQPATKSTKASEKRHPGDLNIEAARSGSAKGPVPLGTLKDANVTSSTVTSAISEPQTPETATSQASSATTAKNGQPRAIRVLPTSRNETPGKGSASSSRVNTTSVNTPSRRESLSSVNPPGTPISERISDNVSLTSTSISRANSPPPTKVGTAPVRVSKSQQKKERQARAKQADEASKIEEAPVKPAVEEPVQAPIIGRKKKQKKTVNRGTADSTPVVTRPSSPLPSDGNNVEENEASSTTPVKDSKKDEAKGAPEPEAATPLSPEGPPTSEPPPKNSINPATLFAALLKSNDVSPSALDIFKPVLGLNHRFDIDPHSLDHMPEVGLPPSLTETQIQQIAQGEPVCVDQNTNKPIIVLPDRRTLRHLSQEQATRYLALRKRALQTSEQFPRHCLRMPITTITKHPPSSPTPSSQTPKPIPPPWIPPPPPPPQRLTRTCSIASLKPSAVRRARTLRLMWMRLRRLLLRDGAEG